jgi:hypothetical protein
LFGEADLERDAAGVASTPDDVLVFLEVDDEIIVVFFESGEV